MAEKTETTGVDRLAEMMAKLLEKQDTGGGGLTPEALEAILDRVGQSGAQGMKDALTKDHEHPDISPYTYPEGSVARPKPKLRRKTVFNGAPQDEERLTPAEVLAFNAIDGTRTARKGQWKASVGMNGSTEELHVQVPAKTQDQRNELPPSLTLILRELAEGPEAVDIGAMAKQLAELQAKLAAVKTSAPV